MSFYHYRSSIFYLVHGFGLALYGLFQDTAKDIALMLTGGSLVMVFGAFRFWIAKQTDPDEVDISDGMSSKSKFKK